MPDGAFTRTKAAMTKAKLVKWLAEASPHLYRRDAEAIVAAIFNRTYPSSSAHSGSNVIETRAISFGS
jgi:hypothetical protein